MNELADRLDKELVEFEKVVDRLLFSSRIAKTQEYEELASLLIECRSEVSKALRFAADMERLESRCENIRLHKNGGAWYLDADCMDGPNIHSVENNQSIFDAVSEAARKAVEALENGEGK